MSLPFPNPCSGIRRSAPNTWCVVLLFLGLFLGAFLGACGGDPPKATKISNAGKPKGAAIRFADVKPIFQKSCTTGCHGPDGTQSGVPFDDVKRIKLIRVEMYRRLTSKDAKIVMPQGDVEFQKTEEGKFLIEWLRQGADVMTDDTLVPDADPVVTKTKAPAAPSPTPAELKVPVLERAEYAPLTLADVQAIAASSCGSCHGAGGVAYDLHPLVTLSDWQTGRNSVLSTLENGSMPKGTAEGTDKLTFLNSADGKRLYGWAKFGQDITGIPPP
jgi:mono/diheme cytochrome c family protein